VHFSEKKSISTSSHTKTRIENMNKLYKANVINLNNLILFYRAQVDAVQFKNLSEECKKIQTDEINRLINEIDENLDKATSEWELDKKKSEKNFSDLSKRIQKFLIFVDFLKLPIKICIFPLKFDLFYSVKAKTTLISVRFSIAFLSSRNIALILMHMMF
jgi:hypothetical protein